MQPNQISEAPLEMDHHGVVFNIKDDCGVVVANRLSWSEFEDFWVLINIAVSQIPEEGLRHKLARIGARYGGAARGNQRQGRL